MPERAAVGRPRRRVLGARAVGIALAVLISPLPIPGSSGGAFAAPAAGHWSHLAGPVPSPSGTPTAPLAWVNLDAGVGSNRPPARDGAAIAYDPPLNATIMFGGYSNATLPYTSTVVFQDTWEYANGAWVQVNLDAPPPARFDAQFAWDPADGYLLMYGGLTVNLQGIVRAYTDTWAFVNQTWQKLTPGHVPPGLFDAGMAWDAADAYMVLYGGENVTQNGSSYEDRISDATWSFVNGQWTNRTLAIVGHPGPTYQQMMAYDPAGQRVVMFGGESTTDNLDTTWTYSGDTWSQDNASTHPPTLFSAVMASDPALDGAILYGGVHEVASPYSEGLVSTTWLFSAGNWTNLTAQVLNVPTPKAGEAITYQPDGAFLVLFGGDVNRGLSNETWSLGPPVIGGFHASPSPADEGGLALFNATPWGSVGTISYSYAGLPSGCVSANVSVLDCRPNATGRFELSVRLTDSVGFNVSYTIPWQVNVPPQVVSFRIAPPAVTIGATVAFSTTASGGTPSYSYTFAQLPNGCAGHGAANFSCAPSETGVFNVTVTLRDRAGGLALANATLTVNVLPALITFFAEQPTIDLGEDLNLTVVMAGGTAPYQYFYAGLPANCLSMDTDTLTCTPRALGAFTVTVNVTDAFGHQVDSATSVQIDAAPTVRNFTVAPTATDVGRLVGISLMITGGTTPLQYTYLGLPPGCEGADGAALDCTPTEPGNYTLEAVVADSTGWTLRAWASLVVAPPLTVAKFAASPLPIDAEQSLTFTTGLVGGTAPFTYTYLGLPAGCGGAATASYVCQPAAGTFQVTLTVEDAVGARASQGLVFSVSPPAGLELVSPNVTDLPLGGSVTIAVVATGGAAPYAYSYGGLPPGCPNADTTNLTCTPTVAGTFSVTVTMTDGAGERASQVVTIDVTTPSSWLTPLVLGAGTVAVLVAAGTLWRVRRGRRPRGPSRPRDVEPVDPPDGSPP